MTQRHWPRHKLSLATALAGVLLVGLAVSAGGAENAPEARFHGAPTYDLAVTNVKWEAATPDYSFVTFDLSWSFSWRAKWVEPAKTSVTGKDLEVENWDAAWVFVKFLPEKDSAVAKERNHWQHATLDKDPASHVMPAGATNTVKLSDDGARGMGVFIYRDALGHGANNWKGVKLRWLHGADKVDPAKAAVAVHPIAMVCVPAGPFKIGQAVESGLSHFADGPDIPIARYDGEQSFTAIPRELRQTIETITSKDGGPCLRWDVTPSWSHMTDGGWRGGPMIPFLVDAEWNGPVADGTRARRVGPVAGQLWSTHSFSERGGGGGLFGSHVGGIEPLNDDFPTGYDAFYCMKYDLTQGQYVDFLNSLPPDVAAGRAFVSSEITSDAGMHGQDVKVDLGPDRGSYTVRELAGHTIRSSADVPAGALAGPPAAGGELTGEKPDGLDEMLAEIDESKKGPGAGAGKQRPVFMARCPFRRIPGVSSSDTSAYAVWAGLRPMSELEGVKAQAGPRDPLAPADWAPPKDYEGGPELLDAGQPTERFARGHEGYGSDLATRVGCRSTPTSDRGTALATYWGISELGGPAVSLAARGFRGTHGGGALPAGTPGASFQRRAVEFAAAPADWPKWGEYNVGGHCAPLRCRLVAAADSRSKKPAPEPAARALVPAAAPPAKPPPRADLPRVANIKVEPGKEYSTMSFDLAWNNSWRAKWEEPAEKNVTGKPLKLESWDAAWVFVKFRPAGAKADAHAMLAASAAEHSVPAGAALDVGLDNDDGKGLGVFIYRNAVGTGANDFKKITLRWVHGATVDPGKVEVKVHALAMVYVPEGPFASRSPWGHRLTLITTPNATQPGGHLAGGPENLPRHDEWPNGYPAFYCLKYSITQGEYAALLNSVALPGAPEYNGGRYACLGDGNFHRHSNKLYGFNGHTITTNAAGTYIAEAPDRACKLMSLPDILSFAGWAGLRLPSNLEYEKACRGPRAVASGAAAWAPATCAPAAGLDKSVLGEPPALGPGPSYWGIRELSLSGCVQEWPTLIQNESPHDDPKGEGCGVKDRGRHGTGSPEVLEEWPWTGFAEWYYGGIWRMWGYGTIAQWIAPAEVERINWDLIDASRTGRYGARAVRTAPATGDKDSPLTMDPPPSLSGADVGIFYLAGRFRNDGEKPLKVELTSPLPAACFPAGAASRAFTAAPKAATPFKILTAVTRQTAAGAVRRGGLLPVQIQAASGGRVLADSRVKLALGSSPPPAVGTLAGGAVTLRLVNAAEQPFTAALTLAPPPEVKVTEKEKRVEVGAKAAAPVAFAIPRQFIAGNAVCRLPYRVTVAKGAPQDGETAVELQVQSRWWLSRRIQAGPKLDAPDEAGGGDDLDLGAIVSAAGDVFQHATPPKGWEAASAGTDVPLAKLGPLPSAGSLALAATRVLAPAAREAVVSVQHRTKAAFIVRVWINDEVVFERPPGEQAKATVKPFRLRQGGNPLVVECQSKEAAKATPGEFFLTFSDTKDGKPVAGLVFDVEQRP